VAKSGASIVNLHHNTLWNPFINYPYADESVAYLRAAVRDAHTAGLRLKVYYTTREITQNMPEFLALAASGEVVYRKPSEISGWPVTNPTGPHPWLISHVGSDVLPAWRETVSFSNATYAARPDLAVITRPGTRWDNYYLAGLAHLVEDIGIDGIYIDDTALDRDAMMRARRILDADGRSDRRIDMHSWNHYNQLAGWASSAIVYMELYPFADRLWYGECFSADRSPEYWLIERSGIPFGLMSEQLQDVSVFRGLVFGMTPGRPGWSGWKATPEIWKLFDSVSLGDAEMIGWWDARSPLSCDEPAVCGTVWKLKEGGALVAIANFSQKKVVGNLSCDCVALGLNSERLRIVEPRIEGVQDGRLYECLGKVELNPGTGLILRLQRKN